MIQLISILDWEYDPYFNILSINNINSESFWNNIWKNIWGFENWR